MTVRLFQREGKVEAGVMTTSTHTGEDKEEGRKGVGVSNSAVLRDPRLRALIFPRQPTHTPVPTWKRGYLKRASSCLVSQPTHKEKRQVTLWGELDELCYFQKNEQGESDF